MAADAQELERIYQQAKQLPPNYRLLLIQRLAQSLLSSSVTQSSQPHILRFGEFGGDEAAMSTLEDFIIGEWRPTDEELDGA